MECRPYLSIDVPMVHQLLWRHAIAYPGRLDAAKLRAIFHRLETAMRSEKSEEKVPLAFDTLDIDHILPQTWHTCWPLPDGTSATATDIGQARILQYAPDSLDERFTLIVERERAVSRIGNLTLVHYGVNRSLQNHAYDRKRQALFEHSNLRLNRVLMTRQYWDEAAIAKRGGELFEIARLIWAGPGV